MKTAKSKFTKAVLGIAVATLIIGIAWFYPMSSETVLINTRSGHARHQALQLRNALTSHFVEFSRFPAARQRIAHNETETLLSKGALVSSLLGDHWPEPDGLGPRKITLLSARKAKENRHGKFHSGIHILPSGDAEFLDPWGNHFRARIDLNRDDQVPAPAWNTSGKIIDTAVIVWSPGPDGKDSTTEDNIVTW